MKKIYFLLFIISIFSTTNLQAQQCPAPLHLTGTYVQDTIIHASWQAVPGANYRLYYTQKLGLQPFIKDVSGVSSALLTKEGANNITACESLYIWASRMDCPTAGAAGLNSDTVLVSPVIPKFTLVRDTLIAYHWFIVDSSYGRSALSYLWSWGDGNTSNTAITSHTYSSSGYYNICLTVTDAYSCSNTSCDSSFYIYRLEDNHPVTVDVVNSIATDLPSVPSINNQMAIKQNPCTECEITGVKNAGDIIVSDILGRIVQTKFVKTANGYQLQFPNLAGNIFIVKDIRTGQVIKGIKE